MAQVYKRTQILMGSPFEIMAVGREDCCAEAIEAAFQEAARIEGLLTIYRPQAPLARFNKSAEKGAIAFDPEIITVLSEALSIARKSEGAFDPTAGPLIDLWGFGPGGRRKDLPRKAEIERAMQDVGFDFLNIAPNFGELLVSKPGIQINLGGIAKGYAIDRAVGILKAYDIEKAFVNSGSTLYAYGDPGWRVMIQDPRDERQSMGSLMLSDQALATSGDYERCFLHKGVRYSHLIDPRTGYPVSGMASVSVVANTALTADAFSTTAFILGAEKGQSFLEARPNVAGFLISENAKGQLSTQCTSRWPVSFSPQTFTRRRFLKAGSIAALGFLLPGGFFRPFDADAASIRFATEKEALRRMMPEANKFLVDTIVLSEDQLKAAQKLAGKGFRDKSYDFWVGRKDDRTVGYALKLNVIGKKRPITFLIGVTPGGQVQRVEVLIYRESKGAEVRYERFMDQFHKKTTADPLRLGRDIRPISGATLSSRATAYAVRKTLAIFKVVYEAGL